MGKSISGVRAFRPTALLVVASIVAAGVLPALQSVAGASGEEGCLLAGINEARQAHGASNLSSHSDLVAIARRHSEEMAQAGRYYHNDNLRSELPRGWNYEGENVGWATSCSYMDNFFMNSATHRKNRLNPVFNYAGIGVVTDPGGKLWVTEVFMQAGSRATAAPQPPVQTSLAPPPSPPATPEIIAVRPATISPSPSPTQKAASPERRLKGQAEKVARPALVKAPAAPGSKVTGEMLAYQDQLETEEEFDDSDAPAQQVSVSFALADDIVFALQ